MIRFSRTESIHLATAVGILTVAFTLVLNDRATGFAPADVLARFNAPWQLYLASFFAVSSGFILHELGHKVIAERYGHWAEFRGEFRGLLISLAVAAGLGFLFAAPGAVQIYGRVTPRENGVISIMGPAINFLVAIIAFPFTFAADPSAFLPYTMSIVAFVNSVLAVFNMLPVGNLDGRKILRWNKPVYFLSLALAVGLMLYFIAVGNTF